MNSKTVVLAIAALMALGGIGSLRFAGDAEAGSPAGGDPAPNAATFTENQAFYPPLQTASKFSDVVQLKLRTWDPANGGFAGGPSGMTGVYYWGNQVEGTGANVWTDMRDFGKHNDAAANDSYWASDAVRMVSSLKCNYLAVPVFLDTTGANRPAAPPPVATGAGDVVTSVTVAVDNVPPRVNEASVVYPANQLAVKTGDSYRVVVNATDDPSVDPACPASMGARPFGVDRTVVDLRLVDGRPSEGTYDDGTHGDGSAGDNTFGTMELVLLSQNPSAALNVPVTVFDIANNRTVTSGAATPQVKVDNTPPTVTNVGISPGAVAADGVKIKVTATVADSGAVNGIYKAYVDASSIGGDPMAPLTGGTTGDIVVATGGKTGKFRLRVVAIDIAGNVAEQSVDIRVQNGQTQVTISGLQANELISGTYKFRAVTINAVRSNISISGGPNTIKGMMAFNVTNGTWEYAVNTIPLADSGTYKVDVEAFGPFDGATPGAVASQSFRVDNNDPSIDINDPKGMEFVAKSISWSKVTIDDAHIKLKQYSVDSDESWVDLATPWDTTSVSDGSHRILFRGVDEAARESQAALMLVVDNHGPTGDSVSHPPESSPIREKTTFSFQVTDTVAVFSVDFEIKDSGGAKKFGVRLAPRPDAPTIFEIEVDTKAVLADGQHSYQVTARDTAWEFADITNQKNGVNRADHEVVIPSTPGSFLVDNSPATANWEDGGGFDHAKEQVGLFTMAWRVEDVPAAPDGAGVDWVKVRIDGGEWVQLTGASDVYTHTWNSGKRDNGLHAIDMWVADKLGHEMTAQFEIAIDNPDNTLMWAIILPVLLFVVLIVGMFMFHRAKAKAIRDTPPPMQPVGGA